MRLNLTIALFTLFTAIKANAQGHIPVLPQLDGDTLIVELERQYKPFVVLGYKDAREIMYRNLYNVNDSVFCVYTGHKVYLDPNTSDAVAYVFRNGVADGINCEHTFPQSLGAKEGNARSDMHHLYPTRVAVNTTRSNLPFGEIVDAETVKWFYLDSEMSQVPQQNIDNYSEWINSRFEPREDHKGNLARAMFYFAAIYRAQADLTYFEQQKKDLCKWHSLDPVDEREWENNQLIASYQSDKANPFILDCTLAYRCFCPDEPPCVPQTNTTAIFDPLCNPIPLDSNGKRWSLSCDVPGSKLLRILDLQGHETYRLTITDNILNGYEVEISRELPSGIYIFHLTEAETGRVLAVQKFAVTGY